MLHRGAGSIRLHHVPWPALELGLASSSRADHARLNLELIGDEPQVNHGSGYSRLRGRMRSRWGGCS